MRGRRKEEIRRKSGDAKNRTSKEINEKCEKSKEGIRSGKYEKKIRKRGKKEYVV